MANIERKYITLGSTCIVLQGASDTMEVYMANSNKEWHELAIINQSGGSNDGSNIILPSGILSYGGTIIDESQLVDEGIRAVDMERPGSITIAGTYADVVLSKNGIEMFSFVKYSDDVTRIFPDLENGTYLLTWNNPTSNLYDITTDTILVCSGDIHSYEIVINNDARAYDLVGDME